MIRGVFCSRSQYLWCRGSQPTHVANPDSVIMKFNPPCQFMIHCFAVPRRSSRATRCWNASASRRNTCHCTCCLASPPVPPYVTPPYHLNSDGMCEPVLQNPSISFFFFFFFFFWWVGSLAARGTCCVGPCVAAGLGKSLYLILAILAVYGLGTRGTAAWAPPSTRRLPRASSPVQRNSQMLGTDARHRTSPDEVLKKYLFSQKFEGFSL